MKWTIVIIAALWALVACQSSGVPSNPVHATATVGASGLDEIRIEARGME